MVRRNRRLSGRLGSRAAVIAGAAALAVGAGTAAAATEVAESEDLKVTVVTDKPLRAQRAGGVQYYRIRTRVTIENLTDERLPRDAFEVRQRLSRTIRPAHFFNWVAATPANRGMGTRRLYNLRFLPPTNRSLPPIRRPRRELRMKNLLVSATGESGNWARLWTHLFVPEAVAKAGITSRITIVPLNGSGLTPPTALSTPSAIGGSPPPSTSTWAGNWQVAFSTALAARRLGRIAFTRSTRAATTTHAATNDALNTTCAGRSQYTGRYFYGNGGQVVGCASGQGFEGRYLDNNGGRGEIAMRFVTGRSCTRTGAQQCWAGSFMVDGETQRSPWNARR